MIKKKIRFLKTHEIIRQRLFDTAKRILERLGIQTSSSFVKI